MATVSTKLTVASKPSSQQPLIIQHKTEHQYWSRRGKGQQDLIALHRNEEKSD
jgi:hypothetical protein